MTSTNKETSSMEKTAAANRKITPFRANLDYIWRLSNQVHCCCMQIMDRDICCMNQFDVVAIFLASISSSSSSLGGPLSQQSCQRVTFVEFIQTELDKSYPDESIETMTTSRLSEILENLQVQRVLAYSMCDYCELSEEEEEKSPNPWRYQSPTKRFKQMDKIVEKGREEIYG